MSSSNFREHGQASIEFALVIPLVTLMVAIGVQMFGVLFDQLAIAQLSRQVARAAAVDSSESTAWRHLAPQRLVIDRLDVEVDTQSDPAVAEVEARYQASVKLPFSDISLVRLELHARSEMWVEHAQ